MGCGASRSSSVTPALSFIPRVEKERDDRSLEHVQLKRLGVTAYDDFFSHVEGTLNAVVNLNNQLHDALWDAKVALAYASSPDPEYALELEVVTEGVRSGPQLLFDVLYAESNIRPLPFEVRHLLTSRPAIAEADRTVAEEVHALLAALQSHPAPAQLSYDDAKKQLTVSPVSVGPSVPGAARQYQKLHQHAARVSSALAAMRKAAPGLRLAVTVVPSPAPGARTFSWRLLARPDIFDGDQVQPFAAAETAASVAASTSAGGSGGGGGGGGVATTRRLATPLRLASAHGAASIADAAATVAQQAAAIAAAVTSAAAPLVQLQLQAGRRLVAVTPLDGIAAATATPATVSQRIKGGALILRSLSLNRGEPSGGEPSSGGGATASKGGIAADARADEAAAVLRRAITSANHALFRLSKHGAAGASSGRDATALRKGDPSAYPLSRALTLVLEAAIRAVRQAAPGAAAGDGGASVTDLLSIEPQLRTASDSGSSVVSGNVQGVATATGTRSADVNNGKTSSSGAASSPLTALPERGGGRVGADGGAAPGRGWSWDWGIQPRVSGVAFPDCLPQKARAVYDAVNRAVDAARAVTEQLPLVQSDVAAAVEEAEAVFGKNDKQLAAAARDMMSAGRMRAALDRNANTIAASPALVGLLRIAVARLLDELRRGAEAMRDMAAGEKDPDMDADGEGEGCNSRSPRGSGSRSLMTRQLNKAAAVAAAAVAAAAAAEAAAEEEEEIDGGFESASGLGSELGAGGGGSRGEGSAGADGVYHDENGGGRGSGALRANRNGSGSVRQISGAGGPVIAGAGSGPERGRGGAGIEVALDTDPMWPSAVSRRVLLPPLTQES